MKLQYFPQMKPVQAIEVDPAKFVGMGDEEIWNRLDDQMKAETAFEVKMGLDDQERFIEAVGAAEDGAPCCSICHETFRVDADVVANDGHPAHRRCYSKGPPP